MNRSARRRLLWVLALALLAVAAAVILLMPAPGQGIASGPPPLTDVGVSACEECHAEETQRWRGSSHNLAMQEANEKTVLGDFADARFTRDGLGSRFFRKERGFFVRTDGPGGRIGGLSRALRARCLSAAAVPDRDAGRPLPGARSRLGRAAEDAAAGSAGSISGRTSASTTATRGTGRRPRRTGTRSARSATRRAWSRATAGRRTASPRPSPSPASPARRATGRARVTWPGRAAPARVAGKRPGIQGWWCASANGAAAAGRWTSCAASRSRSSSRRRASRSRPAPAATPAAGCSRRSTGPGTCSRRRTVRRSSTRVSTTRTGRCETRSTSGDPSSRAACTRRVSPARTATIAHDQKVKVGRDEVCSSCHQPEKFATRKHHFHREGGQGRLVRRVPHAQPQVHGRRRAARPLAARATAGPDGVARRAERPERLQRLSPRPLGALERERARPLVPRGAERHAALRRGARGRPPLRARGRGGAAPRRA